MTDDAVGALAADHMCRPQIRKPQVPGGNATTKALASPKARWAEEASRRSAAAPFRRTVLPMGPTIRDLEAAVDCQCICHPQAPQLSLHAGGTDCPCQLTKQEHQQTLQEFLSYLGGAPDTQQQPLAEELAGAAEELGVELRDLTESDPFVINGSVNGIGFYLRERHGSWELVLAAGDNPNADVWDFPRQEPVVCVASGHTGAFYDSGKFSPELALRVAVDGVRLYQLRAACDHTTRSFCPDCGQHTNPGAS